MTKYIGLDSHGANFQSSSIWVSTLRNSDRRPLHSHFPNCQRSKSLFGFNGRGAKPFRRRCFRVVFDDESPLGLLSSHLYFQHLIAVRKKVAVYPSLHYGRLRVRRGRRRLQAQLIGHRLLDNCTLEEVRIVARVQPCGIGEGELAKILVGDEALLDHFERFRYYLAEIRHIEMREVGAEHWLQPKAHPGIEGPHGRSVVRLAAEVEVGGEERANILF